MTLWLTPALLAGLLTTFAAAYTWLRHRYPADTVTLVDTVDALLPQTQCAQCQYPGCRPYAEAIVHDGAALNLCPPGGAEVHQQLIRVMGNEHAGHAPSVIPNVVAVIDENECIGCALCLPPCPVDAIIGAPTKMHTVLTNDCTGCELCVPACPVDCISLEPVAAPVQQRRRKRRAKRNAASVAAPVATPVAATSTAPSSAATARACINCGQCNPVCPVALPAQTLLQQIQQQRLSDAVSSGLMNCIDCGRCDQACPSDIPMAEIFSNAQWQQQQQLDDAQTRQRFKTRFEAHNERLAAAELAAARRREERLARNRETGRWQ